MSAEIPTVHASAVLAGARAVLIRGPSGAGKSRLAFALITAAQSGLMPFARLIGDDRVHVEPCHGRLLVRPAAALAGLIELRGVGIRRLPSEAVGVVGGGQPHNNLQPYLTLFFSIALTGIFPPRS